MRLPVDVVNAVFEAAYFDKGRPDYATLGTCAQVCREWAAHAQRMHFRWLRVVSGECAATLTQRILDVDTRRARALRSCVRIVELGPAVELDFACAALARCPFVYELRLTTLHDELPVSLVARLQTTDGSRALRTMRITAPGARPLHQLLAALPALARVDATIHRFEPAEPPDQWHVSAGLPALRELRVAADHVAADARGAFDALVLAAAVSPSLEALALAAPCADTLPLPGTLASLRSLALDRWDDNAAATACELPTLRELVLVDGAVLRTREPLIDTLPRALVHLAVPGASVFVADRTGAEVDAVTHLRDRVPGLAVLTVHAAVISAMSYWARILFAFCKHAGIQHHFRTTSEMVYEMDLIPCTAFPRYREAANYSYMAPVGATAPSVDDLAITLPPVAVPSPRSASQNAVRGETNENTTAEPPAPPALTSVPLPTVEDAPRAASPVRAMARTTRSRLRRVMNRLKVIFPRLIRART